MAIGLERFRQITSGDRIVLDATQTGGQKSELSLGHKITAWRNGASFTHGTAADQADNVAFKAQFRNALVKAEGATIANLAAARCGLPANWATSGSAISAKKIQQVLDEAQSLRKTALDRTDRNLKAFMGGQGNPNLQTAFAAAAPGRPLAELSDPALQRAVRIAVKRDANYAKDVLTPGALDTIARNAIAQFHASRADAFTRTNPGLAQYAGSAHATNVPHQDSRSFASALLQHLVPGGGHPLAGEPPAFHRQAGDALMEIRDNPALLKRTAYDLQGMNQLEQDLLTKLGTLHNLEHQLQTVLAPPAVGSPATPEGQALQQGLVAELRHQADLVTAKLHSLIDVRDNHPLSEKNVAYNTKLWAHAAGYIMDQAKSYLDAHPPGIGKDQAKAQLDQAKLALTQHYDHAYTTASSDRHVEAWSKANKNTHPAVQQKNAVLTQLRTDLANAGVPPAKIEELLSKQSQADARRTALNNNQTFAPMRRELVVVKEGTVGRYESNVVPASQINPRFAREYAKSDPGGPGSPPHAPRAGVAAVTKDDEHHARNLKVSTLERIGANGQPERMATVIGHGVLDMWDIEDPDDRATANARGAHEVLEAAISTNARLKEEALNRANLGNPTPPGPVKIVHVSVNLTTPAPLREKPVLKQLLGAASGKNMEDYQEKTYTEAQFAAFRANSTEGNGGHPLGFKIDDDRQLPLPPGMAPLGQDADISVDVDVISFSFAINGMATGGGGAALLGSGTWGAVYEHNRGMMEKFVGDLGDGEFGSKGTRPGGFIGQVMDGLNPGNAAQQAHLEKMQVQANVVRELFTSEAFKKGNGDPAKMGREILALQAMAEQALEMTQNVGLAATMSKGCKSDKDRGGVTDVELKHKLITEDMGGEIEADKRLDAEDQLSYYETSVAQFPNQQLSTGFGGSKEIEHMKQRVPDAAVREYLAGLGKFTDD